MPVQEEFLTHAAPFRAELIAHCYRMLGSVHDAEDLVQETYLRGWRGYEAFEERAALRTWLYRIATTACCVRWKTGPVGCSRPGWVTGPPTRRQSSTAWVAGTAGWNRCPTP